MKSLGALTSLFAHQNNPFVFERRPPFLAPQLTPPPHPSARLEPGNKFRLETTIFTAYLDQGHLPYKTLDLLKMLALFLEYIKKLAKKAGLDS